MSEPNPPGGLFPSYPSLFETRNIMNAKEPQDANDANDANGSKDSKHSKAPPGDSIDASFPSSPSSSYSSASSSSAGGASDATPWYYAVGEQRQGPISHDELTRLIGSGAISESDLIWREGMENWQPASDLKQLANLDDFPQINEASPVEPPRLLTREKLQRVTEAAGVGAAAGTRWLRRNTEPRTWVLAGFAIVLMARGCDSLGEKGVARLEAKARLTRDVWEADYDRHRSTLNARIKELEDDSGTRTQRVELQEELAKLDSDEIKDRRKLESGAWHDLEQQAQQAADRHAMRSYWRQWALLAGVLMLTVSLRRGSDGRANPRPDCSDGHVSHRPLEPLSLWCRVVGQPMGRPMARGKGRVLKCHSCCRVHLPTDVKDRGKNNFPNYELEARPWF